MHNGSAKLIRVGIECEQVEEGSWGVARLVSKLLKELASRPELRERFRFRLYFKSHIPDWEFLNDPIFEKEVVWQPLPRHSFVLYYYVFLPIRLWFAGLDAMYYPNYMLPIIHPRWVPSLVMLTEDIWHEMRSPKQLFRHRLAYRVFGYWSAWWATRIMAISHASGRGLERLFGIAPKRIAVNELAVDTPRAVIPMEGRYILYVGQAFERRHLRETIKAFEHLAKEDTDLRLVAIGPDKYEPPCIDELVRETNRRLGRPAVQHFPRVSDDDLARWYAGALTCVYVSDMEAFGLPPLEALSYEVPPVVADKPINREIYGEHAFYVSNPQDIGGLESTMRTAIRDQASRDRIIATAPTIAKRYSWSAHADRWLDIINTLTT